MPTANKEIRNIIREINDAGYEVTRSKGGHYKVVSAQGHLVFALPSTPGRGRALNNLRATLIRKGVLSRTRPTR